MSPQRGGFTLIELLVSMTMVVLIVAILGAVTSQTTATVRYTSGKIEQFREARQAFESMTHRLGQATLNTYWDYDFKRTASGAATTDPGRYARRSELRFTSGPAGNPLLLGATAGDTRRVTHTAFFFAPLGVTDNYPASSDPGYTGLGSLLNTWGYYVEFGDDRRFRPGFLNDRLAAPRWRFRLMALASPAEKTRVYNYTSGWQNPTGGTKTPRSANYRDTTWFRNDLDGPHAPVHVVAENVIALILTPRLAKRDEQAYAANRANPDFSPLAPDYIYDSSPAPSPLIAANDPRYQDGGLNPVSQLPPVMQMTMVAIDESSALRLGMKQGGENLFGLANDGTEGKFTRSSQFGADLNYDATKPADTTGPLENLLSAQHISYRIFTSNVPIRGAKWSRAQTD